ncbi:MAG: hypothetical protein H6624_03495 [Bdellovibrionaceae bacterium]|nr:hypothetical protein [Bdellovibrionales bacterium]MCB9083379.1 hypothetical protein [Pseudobdellovibrionaceae bacterium]
MTRLGVLTCLGAALLWLNPASAYQQGGHYIKAERGLPSDYDPGPPINSEWARLFAETPNYRGIGEEVLGKDGQEKFRWIFGPMWYRGRLGQNEVKAFVVGQEGAQDENVTNRAFTGSTGTKTQKFLNFLGVKHSYLFLNTFVYTINGQLDHEDAKFKWMEQDVESPIVDYRHRLFDYMVEQNPETLSFVMGVGTGGKASVATWVNARGGRCFASNNLANCDTSGMKEYFKNKYTRDGKKVSVNLKNDILVIGVPHPGGASPRNGGLAALQNIIKGFTTAARKVGQFMKDNPKWMADIDEGLGSTRDELMQALLEGEYKYGNAPVPFRDFAFGTNWRMGQSGTSSNRQTQKAIQVFSRAGKYNADGHKVSYPKSERPSDVDSGFVKKGTKVVGLKGMAPGDVPYESPKADFMSFDPGPCGFGKKAPIYSCDLSEALQKNWPDFYALSGLSVQPMNHPSFGHGPIYRGRLNQARVLILADQYSHDGFFSGRALSGTVGQKLQAWLKASGVASDYAILRNLPVDTLGMEQDQVASIALHGDVMKKRIHIIKAILAASEKNGRPTQAVVTLGPVAEQVVQALMAEGMPLEKLVKKWVKLSSPESRSFAKSWDASSTDLAKLIKSKKEGTYKGELMTIAREDLPSHSRWWMGSSGTRAERGDIVSGSDDPYKNYYKVTAPYWSTKLQPESLEGVSFKGQDMVTYLSKKLEDISPSGRDGNRYAQLDDAHQYYRVWEDDKDLNVHEFYQIPADGLSAADVMQMMQLERLDQAR